ncbi:MAG: carboxypeptidase regulatory-like domain-containing protein [Pyrinomonadaceae bacterium]
MLALSAPFASAQETTGNIQGTVKDPAGAVVTGATVTVTGSQRSYDATTNEGGEYNVNQLPPGRYIVTASASGFGSVKREDVPVELGRTLQVNFDLTIAGTAETVNVTAADEAILDVTSTKTATNITQEKINLLPKTLRFSSVIEVATGVRNEVKGGGFQIDGASGSENVFVVDGLEVTRVREGTLGLTKNIPFDFVKEVQVKSAGYEAEFGGATGGVINVVTRSGTNDFHGEARLEVGLDNLNASDRPGRRFDRLRAAAPVTPTAAQLAAGVQPRSFVPEYFTNNDRKDDFRVIAPAFNLGGPILKNKLWFYSSYAPQFEHTNRNIRLISQVNPGATVGGVISRNGSITQLDRRTIEYTNKYDYLMTRLDFSPWQKLSINVTGINSPVEAHGPTALQAFETTSATTFGNLRFPLQGGYTPSNQISGTVNYSITPNLVVSGRLGRTYLNDKGTNYDVPTGPVYIIQSACAFTGCPVGSTSTGNPGPISTNSQTLFDITTRKSLYLDATYTKRLFGQQHQIKGGYQRNQLANNVDTGLAGGQIQFFYGTPAPVTGSPTGTFGYYNTIQQGTKGKAQSNNQGLYIQDAWQVHPRVTLNLGVRVEKEFVPAFPLDATGHPGLDISHLAVDPLAPISFGWGDKIAPRLGAAWDVFGTGKLKIYGSYSVFYDTMKYELPRGSFGGDIQIQTYRALDTLDFRSISLANLPGRVLFQRDERVPSLFRQTNAAGKSVSPVDPNLLPIREHEFTIGTDYTVGRDMVISGRFTRKQLDRAIEDIGIPFVGSDGTVNEVFQIGNPGFGTSVSEFTDFGLPATPKAVREYTGFEIRVDKRFSNNYYINASYLRSKLFGNYSGLASSDETGRNAPNVNRYFDLPTIAYDGFGNLSNGRLATDRPNTFKAFGAYRFNYGFLARRMETELGFSQFLYQGTPITTVVNIETVGTVDGVSDFAPSFVNGRGDLGRTPVYTQTDALIRHKVFLTEGVSLNFTFNVLNLFNEANVLDRSGALIRTNQTAVTASNEYNRSIANAVYEAPTYNQAVALFLRSNGDYRNHIANFAANQNPFYNKPTTFQGPRNARFSVGVQF